MRCRRPHCHGTIRTFEDVITGQRYLACSACNRDPRPQPTLVDLKRKGVVTIGLERGKWSRDG